MVYIGVILYGHGDLVSRLILGIARVTILLTYLLSPHGPPSMVPQSDLK